jgi:glycosyltransferase involved in cell wall biosynthesis
MRRVAILCNYKLIPDRIGGMDYFFKAYNEALLDLNYKVDWFFSTGEQHEFYKTMPLKIANSDTVEAFFYDKTRETDVTYDFIITHFVELCTKWFKRVKSRFPDSKIIAVDHNPRPLNGFGYSKQIKKKIKGVLYSRYTDLFVGVSRYSKDQLIMDFGRHIKQKCKIIHNGIDTKKFVVNSKKNNSENFNFLVSSHLRKEKAINDLIEAINLLDENNKSKIRVDVYGEGPAFNSLQKLIEKFDLTSMIIFKGSVSNLEKIYNKYDYLIHPSKGETFCFSVVESLVCKTPVITTKNAGNVLGLVKDSINGYLFEEGNYNQLKNIIENLVVKKLRLNVEDDFDDKFSIDTMVKNHIKYLE